MTSRRSWWCSAGIVRWNCPTKLEVSFVAPGCRNCPFTISKQWNCLVIKKSGNWQCSLNTVHVFCALTNLASSYLRNMMANDKYEEDTSIKKRIRCVEQTREKNMW